MKTRGIPFHSKEEEEMGSKNSSVFRVFLVAFFLFSIVEAQVGISKFFNVLSYGAKADGKTDNSKAFLEAWKDACEWKGRSRVYIPKGTYKLGSVLFLGPCEGPTAFVIKGTLKAPTDTSYLNSESWINFRYVDMLTVSGGGSLDGEGAVAWPRNECQKNPNCPPLPTTMRFDFVTNSKLHNLRSINSKNNHFMIYGSSKLNITRIRISAPSDSPNTDGIKIGDSNRIKITNSIIGTGDDCVSILSGSRKIFVSRVVCGPGHGISIGSLGKYGDEDDVKGISVRNCTFKNTTDGVRIKTWASNGALNVDDVRYEDLLMENVRNPIVIDQQYCPVPPCNQQASSMVQISNVRFKNIWGSSSSEIAETLRCSKIKPCKNIVLQNISLRSSANGGKLLSSCFNVNGFSYGHQDPPACI